MVGMLFFGLRAVTAPDFVQLYGNPSPSAASSIIETLEMNRTWRSTLRAGEPQLGRRGLYPSMGGRNHLDADVEALSAVLGYADGTMDMIAIADAHGRSALGLAPAAAKLHAAGLIAEAVQN